MKQIADNTELKLNYRRPQLEVWGKLGDLTAGGSGHVAEGMGMGVGNGPPRHVLRP